MDHIPTTFFVENGVLDLEALFQLQQPPQPFTPGTLPFWDDPHISQQMLAAHLDPSIAAASRPPDYIDRSVAWMMALLDLRPDMALLDLGCGPGLYSARFAAQGLRVTGVDYSRRSIDYAIQAARQQQLAVSYRYQDYLTLDDANCYDIVLLIYGDFCTLPPAKRSHLLQNIHQTLRPGGHVVLDVSTRLHRQRHGLRKGWYAAETGFWKPGPHLVLEQGFDYPADLIALDQYLVIEPNGTLSVYRNWFQDYTPELIAAELTAQGFRVQRMWADLLGSPVSAEDEWIGLVVEKP